MSCLFFQAEDGIRGFCLSRGLGSFGALGFPMVIGLSRKRFLGEFLHDVGLADEGPEDRLEASVAAAVLAAERGELDGIIEPAATRSAIVRALRALKTKRANLPPKKHGNIPL